MPDSRRINVLSRSKSASESTGVVQAGEVMAGQKAAA
jgi:hypothetical protein